MKSNFGFCNFYINAGTYHMRYYMPAFLYKMQNWILLSIGLCIFYINAGIYLNYMTYNICQLLSRKRRIGFCSVLDSVRRIGFCVFYVNAGIYYMRYFICQLLRRKRRIGFYSVLDSARNPCFLIFQSRGLTLLHFQSSYQ